MFEEVARRSILAVVWIVLVLRSPAMVRDSRQRRLWLVLAVFAGGSIVIQPRFGSFVNAATGITQFNNLVQGVWGVLNAAVMLEFVVNLALGKGKARLNQVVRIVWAVATVAAMVLCFAITPGAERFTPAGAVSGFAVYAVLSGIYMIGAAGSAAWLLWCRLPYITGTTLYAGLLMVTVGNAIQAPFMVIHTLQRLVPEVPPELLTAAFALNTTRFIMVPLGCVIAAVEPSWKTVLYWYRRVRLYALWRRLRDATKELALTPPTSRTRDLLTIDDAWERLHRRVVEVHDSVFYLYDTWAWPELLVAAKRHAEDTARPERRRIVAVACWIEVTRRAALSGMPRLHRELDPELLPELQAAQSTMRAEIRHLVRLDRAMRSRRVQAFTREMLQRHRRVSTP
ncbi:MAG: DUF6545 domain-containing protein [Pseudonocardiaceae bacterium]